MSRANFLIAAALLFAFPSARPLLGAPARHQEASPILAGTVRDAGGKPMEGVAVSAAAVGGTITASVYTDEQGRYYFPPEHQGSYR
ncbi:MAG: carboxypeptidase-like regulatory domain-containing protein, partial [Candidatus Acidiferrales bacterium]